MKKKKREKGTRGEKRREAKIKRNGKKRKEEREKRVYSTHNFGLTYVVVLEDIWISRMQFSDVSKPLQ